MRLVIIYKNFRFISLILKLKVCGKFYFICIKYIDRIKIIYIYFEKYNKYFKEDSFIVFGDVVGIEDNSRRFK